MPLEYILNRQVYYIYFFIKLQLHEVQLPPIHPKYKLEVLIQYAAKPITTLNIQNCANILVNMEYILYLCVI